MNKTAQQLINEWAIKKYDLPEGTTIRLETENRNDGYCPTCDSPYACVAVYAKHASFKDKKKGWDKYNNAGPNETEVAELRNVAIHDVLLEVLAAQRE